ncbi:MAG: flagellar basal-body MS-ring/collar protein FliF, partial [Limisphaerales bacterium]
MNQFGTVFKQLQTIWSQLGINQKVTLSAMTLAVLIGLGSLGFWSSRPSYSMLYGKLDESEAAKVIAHLDEAKIPYQVSRGSGNIMVPADKVHTTRMQLASKGLPKGEGVGFEIFDRSNFGISDFVQRANFLRAVQGELSRTISQVESVESARVMIVMPENRLLVNDKNKPTASVFVKVRSAGLMPQQTVNAIRFLVSGAVEGLKPQNVSVIDNSGNVLSDSLEPDSVVGLTQTQLEVRKKMELYLAKKAEGMLEMVLGPGQSVVCVSAEMNFDTLTRTEEKYDPEGQVLRISTVNDESTDSFSTSPGALAPGVDINTAGETNMASAMPQNNNRTKKKITNNQFEINKTTSSMVQAAGSVQQMSAAVFIASKMTGTGTNRVAEPRSKEELDKIRTLVQSALGIQQGTNGSRKDVITVEEMPFNDNGATELTATLQKDQRWQQYTQIGQTVAYPLMGLIVLAMLWRVFKRAPDVDIPIGVPVGERE